MAQQPPSERARALRIRKRTRAKLHVPHGDAAWLADYEDRVSNRNKGASRSASKKTTYTHEEHAAEAEGTGSAAETAAAAAMVYEEGRRQDHVVDRGITALEGAVNCYKTMVTQLLAERKEDSVVSRAMLEAVREHYIKRAEAEADLIHAEADHAAEAGRDPQQELESQALSAMIEKFMADKKAGSIPTTGGSPNGKKTR